MENRAAIKVGAFIGLTFLVSLLLGRISAYFLAENFFAFWQRFVASLARASVGLFLAGLTFCLPALFLTTSQFLWGAILFNSLGFWLGFASLLGLQSLEKAFFLTLIFALFQYLFFKRAQQQAKVFVDFSARAVFSPKVANFLLALALLFSLSFYFALQTEISTKKLVIPKTVLERIAAPASKILEKSLEEALKRELGSHLGQTVGTQDPGEILKLLQQEAKETAQEGQLRQQLGLRPELFEVQKINLTDLKVRLQEMIQPFVKYLPFLTTFLLFLTLRLVVGFLMIFLPWLIVLMFRILLKIGVLRVVEKTETVRRLAL